MCLFVWFLLLSKIVQKLLGAACIISTRPRNVVDSESRFEILDLQVFICMKNAVQMHLDTSRGPKSIIENMIWVSRGFRLFFFI